MIILRIGTFLIGYSAAFLIGFAVGYINGRNKRY